MNRKLKLKSFASLGALGAGHRERSGRVPHQRWSDGARLRNWKTGSERAAGGSPGQARTQG